MEAFNDVANILILVAWPAVALFIGYYWAKSPWRKSLIGKTMMYKSMAMLLLLTLSIAANWFSGYPGEPIVRAAVYLILAIVQWRLFISLRYAQTGKVTLEHPDYKPMRGFFSKVYNNIKSKIAKDKPSDSV